MLVSLVSLPLIQSTISLAAPASAASACRLAPQEREYLEQLIAQASAHAARLSIQLHSFFDTKSNKEPYKVHVQKFQDILVSVRENIIAPLETTIAATPEGDYKTLLNQVLSIVIDLGQNLEIAHATFKKNEGNGFLAVSNALGNLKDTMGKRLPTLEKKLKTFHNSLLKFDTDLAASIDNLLRSLPKIFEIKLSNLVVVTRVKQRLDY